ncbi:Alpha-1,2-mannosyltransferase [Wickerhamomyces ciferrii]|uniref:Alpha-1,2-mannosyltransferase n=1 Tax=Wickerhamomyces ciferrii (strain ATCC 14091 / BCRC 22168 / CBS 111 / JCM 3599 / NBRC 0793 / NRRL Y-1031 F-60-10) TaxID=1206466 RepID=K0KN88_WICCF|nr:Alpha-1,2-mannosyltransferase [Wickerhamomyces ciferrii]CCH42593.1 Alpha-1,2-mannosyltransferase [Wickerhamomyces ciferrii]
MRILRLRKNQKLAISLVLLFTIIGLLIFTVTNYDIDTSTIQRTFKLENFVNLSNNETHDPTPLLAGQSIVTDNEKETFKLNTNPVEFIQTKYESEPGKADISIEQIYKFKKFLNDEILTPILDEDSSIKKVSSLFEQSHYSEGKKKPHTAGPVKENYREDPVYTKDFLLQYLTLTNQEVSILKKSHSNIVKSLPNSFPNEVVESTFTDSQNNPTNGYVYVGGAQLNFLTLLSIKTLRASGSVLPVEIIIPKHLEFDIELCNYIFPKLNAKCLIMEDFIGKSTKKKIDKYQLKSIAMLISSFQNILFLDGDNMIVENPDYLFFNEPFKSYGLITWPDLWRRSTSPFWYSIANIDVNENKKIRNSYWHNFHKQDLISQDGEQGFGNDWLYSYHDFQGTIPETSSESGQLMINKKTHAKTLFLSIYYNIYGPNYYYPLLTQNSHGEGDKETYISAAHSLGQPYYQVEEFPRDFQSNNGKNRQGKTRTIHAVGQYDPSNEFELKLNQDGKTSRQSINDYKYINDKSHWEYKIWKDSKIMFLHCNSPKLYTWELLKGSLTSMGQKIRLYGDLISQLTPFSNDQKDSKIEPRDFELELFEHMKWYFCDHKDIKIKGLPSLDFDKICLEIKVHIDFLKKSKK